VNIEIPCVCGKHERDEVTLRETLDFRAAVTLRNSAIVAKSENPDLTTAEVLALLSEQYLLVGIESWSLMAEDGKPLPVTRAAITERILSNPEVAIIIADVADDLFGAKVVLPLLVRASNSSPPGPTGASTSARTTGTSRRPKPSSRSSITSIPTGVTARISASPGGASST
jgi:hypothetical protein